LHRGHVITMTPNENWEDRMKQLRAWWQSRVR
jgi:hypothetical protein